MESEDSTEVFGAWIGHEPSEGGDALLWGGYEGGEEVAACIGHPGCMFVNLIAPQTTAK